VQHTTYTNVDYICRKISVFFRASGGSFGSVLDSHAGGPGSIPHVGGSVVKVVVVGLSSAVECVRSAVRRWWLQSCIVECGSSEVRKEEATGCMTAVKKKWSSAKVRHGSPNARNEPRMLFVSLNIL
jgi:hypothetical protein